MTYMALVACSVIMKIFLQNYHIQVFVSLIYFAIDVVWLYDIIRRFIQKNMRIILISTDILMMFWHIMRLVKYEFAPENTVLCRYMWYSYYIPFTFIPVLFFIATLYIGRTEQSTISAKCYFLLLIPLAASVGVMTNDLHQLVFRFKGYNESDYSYGPLYYLAILILAVTFIGIMTLSVKTSVKNKNWIYVVIVVIFMIYGIAYMKGYASGSSEKSILQKMFEMPEFVSIYFLAYWETLVYLHIIPSNTGYEQFFEKSSLRAGLADLSGRMQIKTSEQMEVSPVQILSSLETNGLMVDGKYMLKTYKMKRGIFCWEENIEELNRLNAELEESCNYLEEENYMINKLNRLDETAKRDKQKNEVYDSIAINVMPQVAKVSDIIRELPIDEEGFIKRMKYASVFMVYIKRCSNLRLLADSEEYIDIEELGISISESMEYVCLMNILCHCEYDKGSKLASELILYVYQTYQEIVEQLLPVCSAILVIIRRKEQKIEFYLEAGLETAVSNVNCRTKEIEALGAQIDIQTGEENEYIVIITAESGEI